MLERCFVMIKPDAVRRRLIGECITRLERRGLVLCRMRMLQPDLPLARRHYAAHEGKPYYEDLIAFITSGPVVATVWQGEQAVTLIRSMIGSVRPHLATPGTIRGDFTCSETENIIHASDSPEHAEEEIALWFSAPVDDPC